MAVTPDDTRPPTGYDECTLRNRPANTRARIPRQRRRPQTTTPTDVSVARIETVTMTADEETEAVAALAVLVARFWREHPDQTG